MRQRCLHQSVPVRRRAARWSDVVEGCMPAGRRLTRWGTPWTPRPQQCGYRASISRGGNQPGSRTGQRAAHVPPLQTDLDFRWLGDGTRRGRIHPALPSELNRTDVWSRSSETGRHDVHRSLGIVAMVSPSSRVGPWAGREGVRCSGRFRNRQPCCVPFDRACCRVPPNIIGENY